MLRDRVDAALTEALRLLPPRLAGAHQDLREQRDRFGGPIRVALVGRVSSGKSTLANALLGGNVVATGAQELTYNVNWLRNDPVPTLTIHYKDGRTENHVPPTAEALADLTSRRRQDNRGYLASIDYIVFAYPNRYLSEFDLVDTPGLDSVFATDSSNTMRFLGMDEAEVRAASARHAAKADALVLVFSRGMAASEEELLRDFRHADIRSSVVSPITTIGVLTKVELYWRPDRPDVMSAGRQVASRLMRDGGASKQLYELCPLASLVGAAAATFADADFADLTALGTQVEPSLLARRVRFGPSFAGAELADIPVPQDRRKALFDRFSAYGIVLACELIRGGVDDQDTLRRELSERSGLSRFRRLLVEHFGHRADLIKLQSLIGHVRELVSDLDDGFQVILTPAEHVALDQAAAQITRLEFREHAFREFSVVRQFYEGALEFGDADARDALRLVGEQGRLAWQMLGLDTAAPTAELVATASARHAHWAMRAVDPGFGGPTRRACQTVLRSCENLIAALAPSD